MRFTGIIIFLIISMGSPALHGKNSFKPWGADIRVGDETKKLIKPAGSAGRIPGRGRIVNRRVSPVFNGVQGGAYFMIRFFQAVISPQDGANCRFTPTCSTYGKHAVEKHGAFLGAVMAGERLIRCNPYSTPGYDRVPDKIFTGK